MFQDSLQLLLFWCLGHGRQGLAISGAGAARCSKEARSGPLWPYRGLGRPDTQNEALKPISGGGAKDPPLADVLTGTAGLWQVALVLL